MHWSESAYSETSQRVDRKNRKKMKKKTKQKSSKVDEFYAKLNKHGKTEINIDGVKYKIELKDGEYFFTGERRYKF